MEMCIRDSIHVNGLGDLALVALRLGTQPVLIGGRCSGVAACGVDAHCLLDAAWFARKDEFPAGKLGELMQITLLIKTEGLTQLVQPLKRPL